MTDRSDPDWDAVRADYEAGTVPVNAVAQKHGLSLHQLQTRRRAQGWVGRSKGIGRIRRRGLLRRMLGLIEAQITQLETKLESEPMSATEMRMIESMTKALDKITALEAAENKGSNKRVRMDPEHEAIRDRLVQRVQALDVDE